MSDFADFGRYLTAQRSMRGLSRADVVKATKIPPTLLESLEEGVAERLPERVFVVKQIRAYAAAIGLDADEAVRRFEEIPEAAPPSETPVSELEAARRKNALVMLAAAAVGLVLLGWLFVVVMGKPVPPRHQAVPVPVEAPRP